jgi:glutaconate CoA-transferase subunit A
MDIESTITPLQEAVATNVQDGDTLFVGGFGQCIPFAIAHELIRQRRRGLTLCRSGADILFDLLIAAGCVQKVIIGYLGNPGIGLAHAFRRAVEARTLAVEDWTNFAMVLRLQAGAMGVPFLPTATLAGGDLPAALGIETVTCPYTGETLRAVPALRPDVAILHVHAADAAGNLQVHGLSGDTVEGALASRRIIATTERIVTTEEIRRHPERTIVPGFMVAAVAEVPMGAHPSYVAGAYGRDDEAYAEWDRLARDAAGLEAWIEREIRSVPDFATHIERLGRPRLQALIEAEQGR